MREAIVYFKSSSAAKLQQHDDGSFTFSYLPAWIAASDKPAISLTLPKTQASLHSPHLFPFFVSLLPEGANKKMLCQQHKIDADDAFGLLLIAAQFDAIGAITVKPLENA